VTGPLKSAAVHLGRELVVHIPGPRRHVDHLLRRMAAEGIEVLAHCCASHAGGNHLLMVLENVEAACAMVRSAGYKCDTKPIIWIAAPCRVGLAALLGQQLRAEGVNILYTYGSWDAWPRAVLVFKTTHDDRAFGILNAALEDLMLARRSADWVESAASAAPMNRC